MLQNLGRNLITNNSRHLLVPSSTVMHAFFFGLLRLEDGTNRLSLIGSNQLPNYVMQHCGRDRHCLKLQ